MRFGVLEHVVATPAFHHAHHSEDPRRFNSNYASLLPLLDRIFGTWQPLACASSVDDAIEEARARKHHVAVETDRKRVRS